MAQINNLSAGRDRMQSYGIRSSPRKGDQQDSRRGGGSRKQTMMELKYLTNNLFDQQSKELSDKAMWGCKQAGIDPNDLYEKQMSDFQVVSGTSEEIAAMRFENYEKRRRNKMRILVELLKQEKLHKDQMRSPVGGARRLGGQSTTNARRMLSQTAPMSNMALSTTNVGAPKSNRGNSRERLRPQSFANLVERNRRSNMNISMDGLDPRSKDFLEQEMDKNNRKMNKLYKIKDALEALARKDVETMKEIKVRRMQKEKAVMEASYNKKFNDIEKDNKIRSRRSNAKRAIQKASVTANNLSLKAWKEEKKELEKRNELKVKRERLTSAKNYRRTNGLEIPEDFLDKTVANYQTKLEAGSSKDRPISGDLLKTQAGEADGLSETNSVRQRRLVQSATRPKSSYSATMKHRQRQEDQQIEQALSDYNEKLFNATVNLQKIQAQKQANKKDFWAKHEQVVLRKSEKQMQDVMKSLTQYVEHSKHINSRLKFIKEKQKVELEDKQLDKAEKIEKIQKILQKHREDQERQKKSIRQSEREKEKLILNNRKQLEEVTIHKRELLNLKKQEIDENNRIEKNLRFINKKRLVEKQCQVNQIQQSLKEQKRQILNWRVSADLERQEIMQDLHRQVRYIKDHFINQQEEKEKQEAAKKAKELKMLENEAANMLDRDDY